MCDVGMFVQSDLKFTMHCTNLLRAHFHISGIFLTLSKDTIGILYAFVLYLCHTNLRICNLCLHSLFI